MRFDKKEVLTEHITKEQSPLVQARISLIPTYVGADWRDLPNRIMKLIDGKMCDVSCFKHTYYYLILLKHFLYILFFVVTPL